MICEFCISEYIFKRKEKGFANFDFDSIILNANFLYVRLDKDNVSLSNLAERGEVQGRIQDFFLGGGALVSCSTSTPINHIVFLQNTSCIRKPQVISGGGCAPPAPSP